MGIEQKPISIRKKELLVLSAIGGIILQVNQKKKNLTLKRQEIRNAAFL